MMDSMNLAVIRGRNGLRAGVGRLMKLGRDEEGASAIEYAIIVGLLVVAIIAAVGVFTGSLGQLFGRVAADIDAVAP